jgi:DNA replication protein DnaC
MQSDLVSAWHNTGVPKRFYEVQPDRDGLAELEFSGGLYLTGPKGTGKTTAACRILKAYVRENQSNGWVSARFLSVPDWLGSMRGVWGDQEEEAFQRASRCRLLVLDDIGKGKPTEWAIERLFRLVDDRYNGARPTIFTSQYDLGELGERCTVNGDAETADAMVSRIYESCKGVVFDGEDLRRK